MEDFYSLFSSFRKPGKKVLATIINVTGSSYKKEGSAMLFFEDGAQAGMVTAGCLETNLAHQAKKVMKSELSMVIQYNMQAETELGWGSGAGCNGRIDILLEPVTKQLARDLLKVEELLAANIQVLALKKLCSEGEYIFVPSQGEPFGNWRGEIAVEAVHTKNGINKDADIFQHLFLPKPRLFVIGAGPDAKPLVLLAASTGFAVTVCDWREAFCNKENFPSATRIIIGFPDDIIKQTDIQANDFVMVMSHDFGRDQELLQDIVKREIKYVGVLGPRERTRRLLSGEFIPINLHSPAGMDIGAKGPEEIAVSIVAEMIQVLRKPILESARFLWTVPE